MLEKDFPAVLVLEEQMQGQRSDHQWADELEVLGSLCLVAELDGDVIGVAAFRSIGQEAELMRVVVWAKRRQVGVDGNCCLLLLRHW